MTCSYIAYARFQGAGRQSTLVVCLASLLFFLLFTQDVSGWLVKMVQSAGRGWRWQWCVAMRGVRVRPAGGSRYGGRGLVGYCREDALLGLEGIVARVAEEILIMLSLKMPFFCGREGAAGPGGLALALTVGER